MIIGMRETPLFFGILGSKWAILLVLLWPLFYQSGCWEGVIAPRITFFGIFIKFVVVCLFAQEIFLKACTAMFRDRSMQMCPGDTRFTGGPLIFSLEFRGGSSIFSLEFRGSEDFFPGNQGGPKIFSQHVAKCVILETHNS